jgi:hypothetical protein
MHWHGPYCFSYTESFVETKVSFLVMSSRTLEELSGKLGTPSGTLEEPSADLPSNKRA